MKATSRKRKWKSWIFQDHDLLSFGKMIDQALWVWVWVRLRPMDYVPSKGHSMAPNPSESALVASLQARLFHWMTFSTGANTHPEKALLDWFAEDAIATTRLRKCTLSAASPATIFLLYSIQIQWYGSTRSWITAVKDASFRKLVWVLWRAH